MSIDLEDVKKLRGLTGVGIGKCKEALVKSEGDIQKAVEILRKAGLSAAVKKGGRTTGEGIFISARVGDSIGMIEVMCETDFVAKSDKFKEAVKSVLVRLMEAKEFDISSEMAETERSSLVQTFGENVSFGRMEVWSLESDTDIISYIHGRGNIGVLVEAKSDIDSDTIKDVAMHIAAMAPEYLNELEVPAEIKEKELEIAKSQISGKNDFIVNKILEGKFKAFCKDRCLMNQMFVKDDSKSVSEVLGTDKGIVKFIRWEIGA